MRRVTPIFLVALLALAGCGSSTSSSTSSTPTVSSFKTTFAAEKAQLGALGKDVGGAVEGASKQTDTALATQFQSLASRATALAGSLGQLSAPAQYKAELAALQSSVTQVAGALHSIEAAAAAHDAAAAKAAAETLVADAQQVKTDDLALSGKLGLPTTQ
ncbi:MAG TPA: hypothetical protein VF380_09870 [Solirubrobacteraceae bacterium]